MIKVLLKKNTALLLSAQLISTMGSIMQTFALSLYVLQTGTAAQFASVLAVGMLPRLLGPISGVLADRVNRKHMLVVLDIIAGVLTVAFAVLHSAGGGLTLPLIYVLVLVLALIQAFYDPTVYAILPDVVRSEDLENANSASSTVANAAYIAIPALTGALYPVIGLFAVMAINAVSFLLAALLEMLLDYAPPAKKSAGEPKESMLQSLKQGIGAVLGSRELVLIVVISVMANLALNPVFTVGIPAILNKELKADPWIFGMAQSFIFAGPVLGSVLAGYILKRTDYRRLLIRILFADAILVALIALATSFSGGFAAESSYWYLGVAGIALFAFLIVSTMALASIATITAMQRAAPTKLLGRVSGVVTSASIAAIPLGQALFGGGLSLAGMLPTCLFFAALVLAAGIASFFSYRPMFARKETSIGM